ncbi:MAG: hypothetical protein JRD68_09735 [Deltaproteobacteria bacterium]|nr:hypothetical protein [Deltaproteobacteria bacterium]
MLSGWIKYKFFNTIKFWIIVSTLLLCPVSGQAVDAEFESMTIFRFMERTVREGTAEVSRNISPVYEYFRLDAGDLLGTEQNLSFHAYGWARHDLAGAGFFQDDTEGELLYGYLQYRRPTANFKLKIGRQPAFGFTFNDAIDGVLVSSDILPFFSAKVYAGQSVSLASVNGRSGDFTAGGRMNFTLKNGYETGFFYRYTANESLKDEEEAGFDLSIVLSNKFSILGRSEWNMITDGVNEHAYEVLITTENITLRPFFNYFTYENLFAPEVNNASPFRFLVDSKEIITSLGIDSYYLLNETVSLGAKIVHYNYKIKNNTAQYISGLAEWKYRPSSEIGFELGFMNSPGIDEGYILGRTYIYHTLTNKFLSADVIYVRYEKGTRRKDYSFFASAGAGTKLFKDRLEIKASLDYSSDPFFDNDFRGLISFTYKFPVLNNGE